MARLYLSKSASSGSELTGSLVERLPRIKLQRMMRGVLLVTKSEDFFNLMRLFRKAVLLCVVAMSVLAPVVRGADAKPLNREQILALLKGSVAPIRIASLLDQRGIGFDPTEEDFQVLKSANASDEVLNAIRSARQFLPKEVLLDRHRTRARDFEGRGVAAGAEKEYRAALAIDPKDATLLSGLARSLAGQKKWRDAVAAYRRALKAGPKDFDNTYQLAVALEQSGDQTAATNTWADSIKIKSDDPRPFEQLARAFTERRDWRRTIIAYRGLVRLRPESAPAHLGLGTALRNSGNLNGAIEAFRVAVRLAPNDPVAHNNLGFALEEKGDVPAALTEYQVAAKLNPQDVGIKNNLERASVKLRRPSLGKKK